jgi:hypothetical protein
LTWRLLDAPGRPLTREHLLQATRVHEDVSDRSIDVQILRLRRKLEVKPNHPRIVRTERGIAMCSSLRSGGSEASQAGRPGHARAAGGGLQVPGRATS